tara:strand:+ start:176 stop:586 length:411 start_codon:yes stop_codon:yes gene_type:complete
MKANFDNYKIIYVTAVIIFILAFSFSNFSTINRFETLYGLEKNSQFLDKYLISKIIFRNAEYGKKLNNLYNPKTQYDKNVRDIVEAYAPSIKQEKYETDFNNVIKKEISVKLTYIHFITLILFAYGYLISPSNKRK